MSLKSANIWLERGNDFWLWNAALKVCSRPCFEFPWERVMAHSCLPAEALWLWANSAVSSPKCLRPWFHFPLGSEDPGWSLGGGVAPAVPPHQGALPVGRASMEVAGGQLSVARGHSEAGHRQDRKNPGHGAAKAILFGGVRVFKDAHQKRRNLTIGNSLVKAPSEPLSPGTLSVPIMEQWRPAKKIHKHICAWDPFPCVSFFFQAESPSLLQNDKQEVFVGQNPDICKGA